MNDRTFAGETDIRSRIRHRFPNAGKHRGPIPVTHETHDG